MSTSVRSMVQFQGMSIIIHVTILNINNYYNNITCNILIPTVTTSDQHHMSWLQT